MRGILNELYKWGGMGLIGLGIFIVVAAAFGDMEFVPTGGIGEGHLASYLAFKRVVACGGSWMAPQAWIADGAFDAIRTAVTKAVGVVQSLTS